MSLGQPQLRWSGDTLPHIAGGMRNRDIPVTVLAGNRLICERDQMVKMPILGIDLLPANVAPTLVPLKDDSTGDVLNDRRIAFACSANGLVNASALRMISSVGPIVRTRLAAMVRKPRGPKILMGFGVFPIVSSGLRTILSTIVLAISHLFIAVRAVVIPPACVGLFMMRLSPCATIGSYLVSMGRLPQSLVSGLLFLGRQAAWSILVGHRKPPLSVSRPRTVARRGGSLVPKFYHLLPQPVADFMSAAVLPGGIW